MVKYVKYLLRYVSVCRKHIVICPAILTSIRNEIKKIEDTMDGKPLMSSSTNNVLHPNNLIHSGSKITLQTNISR